MDVSFVYRMFLHVGAAVWCVLAEDGLSSYSSLVSEEYPFEGSGFYESIMESTETPEVHEVKYNSVLISTTISSRFATTSTVATFHNKNLDKPQDITFGVLLNMDSLVTSFDMSVNGVTFHSEITDLTAEDHVTRCHDNPSDRRDRFKMCEDMFLIETSISAGSQVAFSLTHVEVIERSKGSYKYRVDLSPHLKTSLLEVQVDVTEPQGLRSVEASCLDRNVSISHQRDSSRASIACKVLDDQWSSKYSSEDEHDDDDYGIMELRYTVSKWSSDVLQTENSYFAYYFSPGGLLPIPKHTIFIIDISGSMAGTKLMQTKSGIIAILRSLPIDDKFNIVTFANNAYKWKPDFVFASKKQITSASRFISMLHPHGGTNIKEALIVAAKSFKDVQRIYRSIVFLTDGVPSVGSTDSARITTSVTNICRDRIAIFCIGIGNELDELLLRNLARNNRGRYSQIEASDKASDEMRTFYQDNIRPVLYDVNIMSDQEVVENSTLTRSKFLAYMDGQEILVAGMISDRLKQPFLNVTTSGEGKDGKKIFLVKNRLNLVDMKRTKRNIDDNGVLERLWAFTKIKDLSYQLRTRRSAYEKSISASRMLQLSHKYGFLTPVTTLSLPLSGKSDEGGDFVISNIQLPTARVSTLPPNMYQILKWTPIYEPFALQNGSVSRVFGDPHFVIDIPLSNLTICFDIQRKEGDILMLIVDDAIGLLVKGEIVEDITSGTKILSLFGRLGITLGSSRLLFSPDRILIDSKMSVSWKKPCRITIDKFNLVIHDRQNVTVTHGDGMRMLIQLHTRIKHPSYFDLFLEDNDGFSSGASGIIGKFKNTAFHIAFQSISTDQDKATLTYRHKQIPVRRRTNPFAKDSFCWHGRAEDFIDDIEEFTSGKLCS